jgi:hypothetical protein
MYVIKNSKGETVAYCSREEDALAMINSDLDEDDRPYTMENIK